jgi:uncharacterized membrane protein YheB (UPF0754 family)
MFDSLPAFLRDVEHWKLATIPVVAAVVGWVTNWVAIKMTFLPLRFIGIRPFLGWQGIIPAKATKMATIFVDQTMHRLGTLEELFQHMDPERIAKHVVDTMQWRVDGITDEIMMRHHGTLWRRLPQPMKNRVYSWVREALPELVRNLMNDVARDVEGLIDFKHMIVTKLEGDKELLNRLFLDSGRAEFRFLINSGFYFGFLFGLFQLAAWVVYPAAWTLPVAGLIVGYATNWLAINLVFRPLLPRRFGPFTIQGLFLKRQKEVATIWCQIVTTEILTLQNLVHEMLNGPRSERVRELIKSHIAPLADEAAGALRPVAEMAIDPDMFLRLRSSVGAKAVEVSQEPFDHWPFIKDRGKVIERLLRDRMEQMPPDQFQDLLRPCFQEDEWILILVGAVLGFLAGLAQVIFMFGGFPG